MKFIRNIHIQTRLLCSFLILSVVPLLVTSSLLYVKSSNAIHQKIESYSAEILDQISQNIDRELARLEYDSIEIMFADPVQNALTNYEKLSEWDLLMVAEGLQQQLVKKFSFLHDVSDVLIYTEAKQKIIAYGDEGSNILNYKDDLLDNILKEAGQLKGVPLWSATNITQEVHKINLLVNQNVSREGIVLAREIRGIDSGEPIGTILIRTNEAYFSNIYKNMDLSKQKILILNHKGQIISANDNEWLAGEYFKDTHLVSSILSLDSNGKNNLDYELDQKYLLVFDKVQNADWYVISFTPYAYLSEETNRILKFTLIIGLISVLLSIVLSFIISKSISTPLNHVNNTMKAVQKGRLDVEIIDSSKDELAEVGHHFNEMIQEVAKLVEQTKLKEKEKRIAELSALQAQINPHFLSNTLNSIKWLANVQGASNIENLISSFIELLHLSMGKDNDFITVDQEITYLKHYLNIQSYRYYDKFKVHFDIDEEVKEALIPRFLVQPLVENALIHGMEHVEEQALLVIKAWIEKEEVHITVTDNGAGISPEAITQIMNAKIQPKNSFNGIGLANVRERIKMYFGEAYDVHIESMENVFTRIEIIYPLSTKGA